MTERRWILVGKVTRPHGLRGEVKVREAEGASGAWRQARQVLVGRRPEAAVGYRVRSVRGGGRFAILALEGLDDPEGAAALREQQVWIAREELPELEEGEYWVADLIGLEVEDRTGRRLGILREIFDNGAHEVYVVDRGDGDLLLPVIEGVVLEIELAGRRMVVAPPPGLPGLEEGPAD